MQKQKTLSSQFSITSGIRQDHSDFVRFVESAKNSKHRGKLYIFTEPASPTGGATAAAKLVMDAIEAEYYGSPAPSITTALEDSVHAANKLLYDYNSGAPPHKQAFVGVTCIATHGSGTYLAQVEPTCAIVAHQGTPRILPDETPRQEVDLTPLGLDPDIDVELNSTPFEPGDTISLMTSGLTRAIYSNEDEYGLSYQDHRGAIEHLYHLAARNNLMDEHALVIENPARTATRSAGNSFQDVGRDWLGKVGTAARSYVTQYTLGNKPSDQSATEQPGGKSGRFFAFTKKDGNQTVTKDPASWRIPMKRVHNRRRIGIIAALIGVIVLLTLAGSLGARAYAAYQQEEKLNSLIAAAEKQRQAAHGQPTQAALQHLQNAREYLADARRIDPAKPTIKAIDNRIDEDWDTVNKVVRMDKLTKVSDLSGYQKGSAARMIILKNTAYVLSEPSGTVYEYDLKHQNGQRLAPSKNVRFTGLSWMNDGLLLLDTTGRVHVYGFKTHKWSSIKLGGNRKWKNVKGFDSYGTNLFVVTPGANGVYVYDMKTPEKSVLWRSHVKKQQMSPASISTDGDLWVIDSSDNSVWRMVKGKVSRRLWVEANPAIQGAFGLLVLDTNQDLYMLDGQQDRVIQFTNKGQLVAQYTLPRNHPKSQRIDAMFADEHAHKLYMIINGSLYSYPLKTSAPKGGSPKG